VYLVGAGPGGTRSCLILKAHRLLRQWLMRLVYALWFAALLDLTPAGCGGAIFVARASGHHFGARSRAPNAVWWTWPSAAIASCRLKVATSVRRGGEEAAHPGGGRGAGAVVPG